MTTVTAIRRSRTKPQAQHKLPSGPVLPLGKQLAHTDKKVRDAAFANVTEFLSNGGITKLTAPIEDAHGMIAAEGEEPSERDVRRGQLPPVEMRRLWKGLFYCFWMSDKPLVQQRLATDLSSVILAIDPKSAHEDPLARDMAALDFIQGFWEAIIREWIGIDRFRMDKYYMLLRRWINASFRLLARSEWNDAVVERYNTIMADPVNGPLAWSNPRTPASLAWHLADIWVEELDKVLREESTPAPIPTLLHPFTQLLTRTPNAQSPTRLLSSIYTPILAASIPDSNPLLTQHTAKRRKPSTADHPDPREKVAGVLKSHASTSEERLGRDVLGALMREAGKKDEEGVRDVNRRKVYAYVRDWGGADEEDSDEEEEDEDDDE